MTLQYTHAFFIMFSPRSLLVFAPLFLLVSCSDFHRTGAQLASEVKEDSSKARRLYYRALKAENLGSLKKAAQAFDLLAQTYPAYPQAPKSNYRAAEHWVTLKEPSKAFDSYQHYITTFRNGAQYERALRRQEQIAYSAMNGKLDSSFLGLSQALPYSEVVRMLAQVRDNAPASDLAAQAQFQIGMFLEKKKKEKKAVSQYFKVSDDYPSHALAPEAILRASKILSGVVTKGSQNRSSIDRAKRTLKDLIQQYPNTKQVNEARVLLIQISNTEIQRTYDIAEFYREKGQKESARFYYDEVVEKATSGSRVFKDATKRINEL